MAHEGLPISSTQFDVYRVRRVSLIKFICFDSRIVFFYFDILSLIKTKMFFCFRCFILISQLIFVDFQNLSRMISQMAFWFSKWDISRYYPRDSFSSGWSALLKARTLRPIYHGRTKQRGCVPRKLPQQPSEQSRKCIYSNCRDYSVSPKAH